MVVQDLAETRCEPLALENVCHAHGAARHLVLVGRTDATARGADRVDTAGPLAGAIERNVRRQDQRAIGADAQPLVDGNAFLHQRIGLAEQRVEGDDHAVADDALARPDAGCRTESATAPS